MAGDTKANDVDAQNTSQVVPNSQEKHTGRKIAVGFLVFLGAVLLIIANFAFWARFTLLNTNGWVAAVGPITKDAEVANTLSAYIVGEIFQEYDVNQAIVDVLPDQYDLLSVPLAKAMQNFATQAVTKVVMSDAFNTVWVGINRAGHTAVMRVLSGNGDVLYMKSGQLVLDLSDVYNFIGDTFNIQNLNIVPEAQDGKLVLFTSKQVAVMQEAYSYINTFGLLMPLLSFLAFGFAILVSMWRRLTLLWIGITSAIAMTISLIVYEASSSSAFVSITDPLLRYLAREIWRVVSHGYLVQTVFFLIIGILVAIGAWQAAPDSWFMQWSKEIEARKEAKKVKASAELSAEAADDAIDESAG